MADLNIKYRYPYNPNFIYETIMERVNLDEERIKCLSEGNGFIISEPQSTLKKDLKNINGIYSTRFGTTLQDINPFADRYKCQCGHLKSRVYNGITCKLCGTKVKYVDDNFKYFGWITLKDPYYILHPNLYKSIETFLGKTKSKEWVLDNILLPVDLKDEDGFAIEREKKDDEPYYGIGLLDFKIKFKEIMDYYLSKNKDKIDYYNDIMRDYDKVFIQSIPVYTTHLRPFKVDGLEFKFEDTNKLYNIMVKLAVRVNQDTYKIYRKRKTKNQLLYDLNSKYQELYLEIEKILAGKKGIIRSLFGGRYGFTSRDVIVPNPKLKIDEVTMPYVAMVEMMQQTIINILHTTYNISYSEAHKIWYDSLLIKNQIVYDIIKNIIADKNNILGRPGIPVLINRNPSINYGSILYMRVVDITDNYVMAVPLNILNKLAADFGEAVFEYNLIRNYQ